VVLEKNVRITEHFFTTAINGHTAFVNVMEILASQIIEGSGTFSPKAFVVNR